MVKHTNRLINESSPYLLQHAHNPVNWYSWDEEALKKAKKEDKPVFLSIGYSTCHWCHVMEKESFEDKKIADYLNKNFVSIKVDREERPDIDNVYMKFLISRTGQGGWPLNVFLTSDKEPFYGGTYFSNREQYGMPTFLTILHFIKDQYENNRSSVKNSIAQIKKTLEEEPKMAEEILEKPIATFNNIFNIYYDENFGGMKGSPKFPITLSLLFNLYQDKNLDKVYHTLKKMGDGGIYDHLAGGFSRYSTDEYWIIPHFEKTLYDNALLLTAYSQAYAKSKDDYFKEKADGIFNYIKKTLLSKKGFYSGQDADSEGKEGKFYVFSFEEIKNVVDNFDLFSKYFNLTKEGNFDDGNILYVRHGIKLTQEEKNKIERDNEKLLKYRNKRINPGIDTKIITSWNSLMISGFAIYGNLCNNNDAIKISERILNNILKNCLNENKLLRLYGKNNLIGFIEDYSFLINSLLDLYEITFKDNYLEKTKELTKTALELFYIEGFSNTSKFGEKLFIPFSDREDNVTPSGISVMVLSLFRLNEVIHNEKYDKIIEKELKINMKKMNNHPLNCQILLQVLYSKIKSFYTIEINGDKKFIYNVHDSLINSPIFNKIIYKGSKKENIIKICHRNTCQIFKTVEEARKFLENQLY